MKVLICDPVAPEAVERLKNASAITQVDVKTGQSPEELRETIPGYNAIIVRSATKVTADVINASTDLKVIARGGIGLDNIDLKAAESKGITVVNTPAASTVSVAELAFAHMIAASRSLQKADASIKSGKWEKKAFKGHELYQKTLGVIGFGRIGQALAKRAKAFEMDVLYFDIVRPPQEIEKEIGAAFHSLDDLLSKSDYITLHLPKTPETTNLLDKPQFDKIKEGAVLINCARGGIVNEAVALEALKEGKLAHYGTDVFETEPPKENPLLRVDNVSTTPHIGAQTFEGQFRVGIEVADKVIEELSK